MTGKWLVCLSLLVVADAASLGPKPIEIPVQVVYDEVHENGLKNLEEKPQLSLTEVLEQRLDGIKTAIDHIVESTVKDVVQQEVEKVDVSSSSSSSEESQESNELKSKEDSSEDESNEIQPSEPEPIQPEIKEPERIPEVQPEEIMIAQEDAPAAEGIKAIEVIEEIKEPEKIVLEEIVEPEKIVIEEIKEPEKIVIEEVVIPDNVEQLRVANPVPDPEANPKQDAAAPQNQPTTAAPFRPLAGLQSAINRLGENIGNVINIIRPPSTNNEATTKAPPVVAFVEAEAPMKADVPIPEAPAAPSAPAAPAQLTPPSPPSPTFVDNLQSNINTQLASFGNRVNSFIDNLKPKAPAGAQNEEAPPPPPNAPFINGMQTQFNNGLQGLTQTVNSAFGFINPNPQNITKEDEAGQQQNQNQFPAVQQILNGVQNFQQNFQNFINGNQPTQQNEEGAPATDNGNVGQQVLQMVTSNIQNIFQSFNRPNNGTQGDEAAQNQNPLSGIQTIFSNIGNQFNNFISGGQPNNSIPTQIPGATQIQNLIPQTPGIPQVPQIPGIPQVPQIPGIDNLAAQIPGAEQIQQGISQIPGAEQFQQGLGQIPGAEQIQQGLSQIPGAGQLPAVPGLDQLPQLPGLPGLPGAPASATEATSVAPSSEVPAAA